MERSLYGLLRVWVPLLFWEVEEDYIMIMLGSTSRKTFFFYDSGRVLARVTLLCCCSIGMPNSARKEKLSLYYKFESGQFRFWMTYSLRLHLDFNFLSITLNVRKSPFQLTYAQVPSHAQDFTINAPSFFKRWARLIYMLRRASFSDFKDGINPLTTNLDRRRNVKFSVLNNVVQKERRLMTSLPQELVIPYIMQVQILHHFSLDIQWCGEYCLSPFKNSKNQCCPLVPSNKVADNRDGGVAVMIQQSYFRHPNTQPIHPARWWITTSRALKLQKMKIRQLSSQKLV